MDCASVADRVAAYLDGELARSERVLFEEHLEGCEACQTLLERVDAVDLSPPAPERLGPAPDWSRMDEALARAALAAATAAATAPAARGWRRFFTWELRVSFPLVAGYAALLALSVFWALANLQRAQLAEGQVDTLAQQFAREQRLDQKSTPAVPRSKVSTANNRTSRGHF